MTKILTNKIEFPCECKYCIKYNLEMEKGFYKDDVEMPSFLYLCSHYDREWDDKDKGFIPLCVYDSENEFIPSFCPLEDVKE